MTNQRIVTLSRDRINETRVGGVYAATYRFTKLRIYRDQLERSLREQPFEQVVHLLRLPGNERKLWLTSSERRRALEALQDVGLERPAASPSGGESV